MITRLEAMRRVVEVLNGLCQDLLDDIDFWTNYQKESHLDTIKSDQEKIAYYKEIIAALEKVDP